MRVVVTGATGNVGTAVVRALAADDRVDSVLGIARRRPALELPKVEWARGRRRARRARRRCSTAPTRSCISPGGSSPRTGSASSGRRTCTARRASSTAAAAAGVGALVHGSSVGVYSPGPKDERVDESWPRNGVRTSFYGRHKAEAEWRLDAVEAANPELRVVRIRPGLVFQRDAASGIRRLFAGPLLPTPLLRPGLLRVVPDMPGLRVQAVHADDVAAPTSRRSSATCAARSTSPPSPCSMPPRSPARSAPGRCRVPRRGRARSRGGELAAAPAAEPAGLARPGARRAADVVRARPRASSAGSRGCRRCDALLELLEGMRNGAGGPTPPLDPDAGGAGGRASCSRASARASTASDCRLGSARRAEPRSATVTGDRRGAVESASPYEDFRAVRGRPFAPAAFFCAVVPPCDEERELPECECSPPFFDAPGLFAIFAARSLDMPLSFKASYCFSFFTCADLPGMCTSHACRNQWPSGSRTPPAAKQRAFSLWASGYRRGVAVAKDRVLDLAESIEGLEAVDPISDRVQDAVRAVAAQAPGVRDALAGTGFGHPLHPPLTDVVVGAWTSSLLLDCCGGERSRGAADGLLAVGIAAAVPTAAAGLVDWADLRGASRRVGSVHALGNLTALGLQTLSWRARRRGDRGRGLALSGLAYGIASVSAWLGGHLSLGRAVGVNQTAVESLPEEWTAVMDDGDLGEDELVGAEAGGTGVLLVRKQGRIHAMADRCSHRGCSLHEGELDGDEVVCPCHGSRFGLDGSLVGRPGRVSAAVAGDPRAGREDRGAVGGMIHAQQQSPPGRVAELDPQPDHGETSYEGHGRLDGKAALITGADSGIGRAVAIAFAREGADVVISYLDEHDDARTTADWVERAGRRAVLAPGDIADPAHCRALVERTVAAFGRIDVLVNNAAFQRTYEQLEDVPDDEWDRHWQTNVSAMFHLCKAALPHMQRGRVDHQHRVGQRRPAEADAAAVRDDQGRDRQLQRRAGAAARPARHPRQLGAARADLDAADPVDDAARPGRGLRQRHAARPPGPACRARARLRAARLGRVELRDRLRRRGHGRPARPLSRAFLAPGPRVAASQTNRGGGDDADLLRRRPRAVHTARPAASRAARAERAGFDGVDCSDHFQPWWEPGESGQAWVWLGAAAQATERCPIGPAVTPRRGRYHPALVAQAFATLEEMFPGRDVPRDRLGRVAERDAVRLRVARRRGRSSS